MERLSINSFLAHGHEYHLYGYTEIEGVPRGAIVKDAGEILPSSMLFEYPEHKTYAGFANFFRYKLLLEHGGWWVDSDVICLKPFGFESEYVLATERDREGREFVTSGIIKVPKGAELMSSAWAACQTKDPRHLHWGETGPTLMHRLTLQLSLWKYMVSYDVFCPVDPGKWIEVIIPGRYDVLGDSTVAVHLWNELWRRFDLDKDAQYAPGCLYERLKAQYLAQR
jgi:hypothetical protein